MADTRSMDERLLPCPFCGGKAQHKNCRGGEDSVLAWVACVNCGAMTEQFEDTYAPWQQAESEWNRRTQSEGAQHAQSGVVEALKSAREKAAVSNKYDPIAVPDYIVQGAIDALATPSPAGAESELREDQEALDGVNAHEHWGVSVDTHGDDLVRIETAMLAGKADLSEQDLATIRTAARHLLSFAGPSRLRPIPEDTPNG